jgi:exodeoxyribonuclease-3
MILSSWNVNSVRARIDNILGYLDSSRPDILMMQEIKTEEKKGTSTFLKINFLVNLQHTLTQKPN